MTLIVELRVVGSMRCNTWFNLRTLKIFVKIVGFADDIAILLST